MNTIRSNVTNDYKETIVNHINCIDVKVSEFHNGYTYEKIKYYDDDTGQCATFMDAIFDYTIREFAEECLTAFKYIYLREAKHDLLKGLLRNQADKISQNTLKNIKLSWKIRNGH